MAASLDGFIAGPNGEFDWIPTDPDIDFEALYARYSGLVMGRRSYEVFVATGGSPVKPMPVHVCSRTVEPGERNGVTFTRDAVAHVQALKQEGGEKPLWLWGGGALFRQLADANLVDGVDVAIIPIVLGGGIPMMAVPGPRLVLKLRTHGIYSKTGILWAEYDIQPIDASSDVGSAID